MLAREPLRRHHVCVIQTWADQLTADLFEGADNARTRKVAQDLAERAVKKLLLIDAATKLEDLRLPRANNLEKLAGDRKGQHSIRVNGQWRICFRWDNGHAYDVEFVDYH